MECFIESSNRKIDKNKKRGQTNHEGVIRMKGCKKCGRENYVKNGKARGKQRYLCKECGYNFIEGDRKTNEKIKARKAMCIIDLS